MARTAYVLLSEVQPGDVIRFGGDDIRVRRIAARDGKIVVMGVNLTRGGELPPFPVSDGPWQVWREQER